MTTTIQKDVLTVEEGIIVHQVNMLGTMGAGLAKAVAQKFPIAYDEYKRALAAGEVDLGDAQFVFVRDKLIVCNLFGQKGIGGGKRQTNYAALVKGFRSVASAAQYLSLPVFIPYRIGCGLGGGDWMLVEDIIEEIVPDAIICQWGG